MPSLLLAAPISQNNPPQVVQEKILALIQGWADAFRDSPDLSGVVQAYQSLKQQGNTVILHLEQLAAHLTELIYFI